MQTEQGSGVITFNKEYVRISNDHISEYVTYEGNVGAATVVVAPFCRAFIDVVHESGIGPRTIEVSQLAPIIFPAGMYCGSLTGYITVTDSAGNSASLPVFIGNDSDHFGYKMWAKACTLTSILLSESDGLSIEIDTILGFTLDSAGHPCCLALGFDDEYSYSYFQCLIPYDIPFEYYSWRDAPKPVPIFSTTQNIATDEPWYGYFRIRSYASKVYDRLSFKDSKYGASQYIGTFAHESCGASQVGHIFKVEGGDYTTVATQAEFTQTAMQQPTHEAYGFDSFVSSNLQLVPPRYIGDNNDVVYLSGSMSVVKLLKD